MKYFSILFLIIIYTNSFAQIKERKTKQQVYLFADVMPAPTFDLNEYLEQNMKLPEGEANFARCNFVIRFIVNENGNISNITMVRGISKKFDEMASRMIKQMPRWKPGKIKGKPVKVYYTLTVHFHPE